MTKLAIVRIRGQVRLKEEIADTLKMLNLNKKNHCAIVEDKPSVLGMIKKVKNYITWGIVNDETIKLLETRKDNNHYRLNPPKGGFERKGIKFPFNQKGALGDRKEKINDLLKRMI